MNEVITLDSIDSNVEFEEFDLHESFSYFNDLCFNGLLGPVHVSWSKRLKLCAGKCYYRKEGYCEIKLSEDLLKYRTAKECKETLLHEMIHAHLFLTKSDKKLLSHGKEFIWHMNRINDMTDLNVTIHHNFYEEVNYYRRHIWRCSGPCRLIPPHFGYIKRSKNLAPGPRDKWWAGHKSICGGVFVKIFDSSIKTKKQVDRASKLHRKSVDSYISQCNEIT